MGPREFSWLMKSLRKNVSLTMDGKTTSIFKSWFSKAILSIK